MSRDTDDQASDIAAALNFASRTTEPEVLSVHFEGVEEEVLLTTGAGGETEYITARALFRDRAAAPQRRSGTLAVHDLASFIAATNRDSDEGSVIFADANARKLTAILDWHKPGRDPRWGQDRIEYGFALSDQLAAWCKAAQSPMDQKTFARLIDDRLSDIGEGPFVADSIAAQFATRRGIRFASVADLVVFTRTIAAKCTTDSEEFTDENTGDSSIQFKKKTDVKTPDGKPVAVPPAFALRIPIFRGAEATEYNIAVRLRYDVAERGGIAWRIELHALDKYILAAIEEALAVVRRPREWPDGHIADAMPTGCGLPVLMAVAPA